MPKCPTYPVIGNSQLKKKEKKRVKFRVKFALDLKPEEILDHLMERTFIKKYQVKSILKKKNSK
jgi:hypothetical protein